MKETVPHPTEEEPTFPSPQYLRCRVFNQAKSRPLKGIAMALTGWDDSDRSFDLGLLASDQQGYLSFTLDRCWRTGEWKKLALYPQGNPTLSQDVLSFISEEGSPTLFQFDVKEKDLACLVFNPDLPSYQDPGLDDWALSPKSFTHQPDLPIGKEECKALVPNNLASRNFDFVQIVKAPEDTIRLTADQKDCPPLEVKTGLALHFQMVWRPLGFSLGDLVYTLPLAPCESVQLAVIDWSRESSASRRENTRLTEAQVQEMHRDRTIEETIRGTVKEASFGFSRATQLGGLLGLTIPGTGAIQVNGQTTSGTSLQAGIRTISSGTLNRLSDHLTQSARAVRDLRSVVITQASQQERETVHTRKICNHNHCHTLTVMYYEILKNYRVTTRFIGTRKVVLIRYPITTFDLEKALCHRHILEPALLDPGLAECFAAGERVLHLYGDESGDPADPGEQVMLNNIKVTISIGNNGTEAEFYLLVNGNSYLLPKKTRYRKHKDYTLSLSFPETPVAGIKTIGLLLKGIGMRAKVNYMKAVYTSPQVPGEHLLGHIPYNKIFKIRHQDSRSVTPQIPNLPQPEPPEEPAGEDMEREDRACAKRLVAHLNCNQLHYNRALWLGEDRGEREIRFSKYPYPGGGTLLDQIENLPVGVVGDWVAFPQAGSQLQPPRRPQCEQRWIHLPAKGVFAEALLGNCNACEVIDETRYWDWKKDDCCCDASDITIETGSRAQNLSGLAPTGVPNNAILSFNTPSEPSAVANALAALTKGDLFTNAQAMDSLAKLLAALGKTAGDIAGNLKDGKEEKEENP